MILLPDRGDPVGRPALMYDSAMHPSAVVIVPPSGACEWRKLSATSTMPYVAAARCAVVLTWAPQVGGRRILALGQHCQRFRIFCAKGSVTHRVKRRNKVKK